MAGNAEALSWVVRYAHALNLWTAQLSAVDGVYEDGPEAYERAAPADAKQPAKARVGPIAAPGDGAAEPAKAAWEPAKAAWEPARAA